MKRFFELLGIGFLASIAMCIALTIVWYILGLASQIPLVRSSLEDSFLGRAIWAYSALLYALYALSIPAGQVYSFWFFRRSHQRWV